MTASASAATVLPVGQKDPPFAEDPVRRELVGGAELDAPARPVVQYHRLAGARFRNGPLPFCTTDGDAKTGAPAGGFRSFARAK